jgi:hypothetical protein
MLKICVFESRACYMILWTNFVQPDRPLMEISLKRIAGWLQKATNTYSEYVILTSFPLQNWFHERATVFHCTYISSLV